jgi:hypothetical protein
MDKGIANCKLQIANCKLNKVTSGEWRVASGLLHPRSRPLSTAHCPLPTRSSILQFAICNLQFAIIFALSIFLAACNFQKTSPQDSATPARSVIEQGPVKVTAEVVPAKARLSDEPVLTLTIDAESGVKVEKPLFGATLGSFLVRDCREPLPKTRENREITQQVLTLEPTVTGRLAIDPINITFTDSRPGGDRKAHTVETKAMTVDVVSLRGDESPTLSELRGAAGPIALPWIMPLWAWLLLGVGTLGCAAAFFFLRRKRREKALAAAVLTPEELARHELEELARSGLAERDVKQFYVELTAVVRRYIERTTGIRAPEQTTEEFLHEIHAARVYPESINQRLKDFLESADLVKFAAHRPGKEDVGESFRRAERFIGALPPAEGNAQPNAAAPQPQEASA